jgi:hypothetical protein
MRLARADSRAFISTCCKITARVIILAMPLNRESLIHPSWKSITFATFFYFSSSRQRECSWMRFHSRCHHFFKLTH